MPSNFLSDFLSYNIGTECAPNYLRWAALSTLAVAAGRRFLLKQGRVEVRPNLYVCLVGDQGTRKSFAKDIARDIISEALPDYPIGADITSREDIIRLLASSETLRSYNDHRGIPTEWHPLALFINELKHFMSFSPSNMIAFVVDIYDRKVFKGSTLKRKTEDVVGPCLNILACENPDWIISNLKANIISGGFSRRFIVVYETDTDVKCIPRPFLPDNARELWERMKAHLVMMQSLAGEFQWEANAITFFDQWYEENRKSLPTDPIIRGFRRTKDQQLLKVAMLLVLGEYEYPPKLVVTVDYLKLALALFDAIEPNAPKLSVAAGRNELAVPMAQLLEILEKNDGWLPEKTLRKEVGRNMSPTEIFSVMRHLQQTEEIWIGDVKFPNKLGGTTMRRMVVTAKKYESQGGKFSS